MPECDVEDILCKMTALSHLKGLKSVLGEERYRLEFPELQSLDDKISSREASLKDTLGRCGELTTEDTTRIIPKGVIVTKEEIEE